MQASLESLSESGSVYAETLDVDAILEKGLENAMLERSFKEGFRQGFSKDGPKKITDNLIAKLASQNGRMKILNISATDTGAELLVRVDFNGGDDGINYLKYQLSLDQQSKVRITDWYDYATGFYYSETIRHLATTLSPTPTLVGKLYDLAMDQDYVNDSFSKIINYTKEGKSQLVVDTYLALKPELKSDRLLLYFATQAAITLTDEGPYLAVLKTMAEHYGNEPSLQMVLLDYYFMTEDYDAVLNALSLIEQSLGLEDAAIYLFLANTHVAMGNQTLAIKDANRAIELEADFENPYWVLLDIHLALENYKQAVEVADTLESIFLYDFSPASLKQAGVYDAFIESTAYQHWRDMLASQ